MLRAILLAGFVGVCLSFTCEDGTELQLDKVGCFNKNTNVFPTYLANNRDTGHENYIGETLDWGNLQDSLNKLACACAAKAKEGGHPGIALGFYGECHGASNEEALTNLVHEDPSNECYNPSYQACGTEDDCVGGDNAQYVYKFHENAPEPIHGGYGNWSDWTDCSASCGEGFQERERACNNPLPANGGDGCDGSTSETRTCKLIDCPVNGGWGNYGSYGPCSKSCGSGEKTRTRECNNPTPAHGGAECEGDNSETASCNTQGCPVDGGWGSYGSYSTCTKTCGSGTKTRTRQCNNPSPLNGGAQCSGSNSQSTACNTQPCLAHASCEWKDTGFNDDGGGDAVYLDRHSLHCPSGKVINYIKLERNSGHDKIRYKYECCTSQLSCSDSLTTNGWTYVDAGDDDNSVYLDRQTVSCYNKGISYLKLDRSGDNWKFKYDCCSIGYSSASVSCNWHYTDFNNDGGGDVVYLDRHTLDCPSNNFITYMKLERNSGHDKVRYKYKCCKINTPSVTN